MTGGGGGGGARRKNGSVFIFSMYEQTTIILPEISEVVSLTRYYFDLFSVVIAAGCLCLAMIKHLLIDRFHCHARVTQQKNILQTVQ